MTPDHELDTIVARAVGAQGESAEIRFAGCTRGWLDQPGNKAKVQGLVEDGFRLSFTREPERSEVVAMPYIADKDDDEHEG